MLVQVLVFLNALIFIVLSCLHIYWVLGGTWAIEYTVPDSWQTGYFKEENKMKVSIATFIVATGLFLFSVITASNAINLNFLVSQKVTALLTQCIGAIFLIRAIGDFNIVGLFKKHSESKFAQKDSQLYVPLCIYLGVSSILITLL